MAHSDNFNRADNTDLGANWDIQFSTNNLQIVGNKVRAAAENNTRAEQHTTAINPAQYAQATFATFSATAVTGMVGVRMAAAGTQTYYNAQATKIGAVTDTALQKCVAGVETSLGSRPDTTWSTSGDQLRCEAIGSTVSGYKNGFRFLSNTDSALTTGKCGLLIFVATSADVADLEFDDFLADEPTGEAVASNEEHPKFKLRNPMTAGRVV